MALSRHDSLERTYTLVVISKTLVNPETTVFVDLTGRVARFDPYEIVREQIGKELQDIGARRKRD